MRLIIITRPDFFQDEADYITSLFRHGLAILHLRKPQASLSEIRDLLKEIPYEFYPRIVLHDAFSLTAEFPVGGIHLNGRNPLPPNGYKGNISRSCHSFDEVKDYKEVCNYLFLSPIYNSISKENYHSAFMKSELEQAAGNNIIDQKVIALGGINMDRLPQLKTWHFGGAAFLGDIWNHCASDDFLPHFIKIKELCDNLK